MASIDPKTERVVIRLVYDGPAWAGKTTTIKSLARSLGSILESAQEADGRTLQFDWVDYVGGLFQGSPIQCQIVGVPGQRVLERRRLAILDTADAVVFVADSRAERAQENAHSFELLRRTLERKVPPVATVVQANKRDLARVVPLEELRRQLGAGASVAMTESMAETGEGVRETFVLAVRLALDRVRSLWDGQGLPREEGTVDGPRQLLEAMGEYTLEPGAVSVSISAAASSLGPVFEATREPEIDAFSRLSSRGPRRPDASVPPGLVWPPVNGRVIVHESAREEILLERTVQGDWTGESTHWRTSSPADALFFDLENGRHALVAWARWHTAAGNRLSASRALVLAAAAPDAWRLWQIVRRLPTFHDFCRQILDVEDRLIGERLLSLVELRLRAERDLVSSGWIANANFAELAISEIGEPTYAGFVRLPPRVDLPPEPLLPEARPQSELGPKELEEIIALEVAPALDEGIRAAPKRLMALLASLELAAKTDQRREVATSLRRMLLRA